MCDSFWRENLMTSKKDVSIYAGRHHHMNIQLKTWGSFWVWNSNSWGGGREISFFLLLIIIRGIHDSEGNLSHSKVKSTRVAQSTFVDWNRISLPWRWALSPKKTVIARISQYSWGLGRGGPEGTNTEAHWLHLVSKWPVRVMLTA